MQRRPAKGEAACIQATVSGNKTAENGYNIDATRILRAETKNRVNTEAESLTLIRHRVNMFSEHSFITLSA